MRVLVVSAHPLPTSFIAALRDRVREVLQANGHEVDSLDLYAEKFDPVLSPQMLRDYLNVDSNTREVETYVRRLRAADALALFFPVWFDGLPAIMQGYFQRVFLPGVSTVIDEQGLFHRNLQNLKQLAAVCSLWRKPARRRSQGRSAPPLRARQYRPADRPRGVRRAPRDLRHGFFAPRKPRAVSRKRRARVRRVVNFPSGDPLSSPSSRACRGRGERARGRPKAGPEG